MTSTECPLGKVPGKPETQRTRTMVARENGHLVPQALKEPTQHGTGTRNKPTSLNTLRRLRASWESPHSGQNEFPMWREQRDPWNNTGMASMSSSTHIGCVNKSQHFLWTNELRRPSSPHTAHTAVDCIHSVSSSSNAMGTLLPTQRLCELPLNKTITTAPLRCTLFQQSALWSWSR